MKIASTLVGTLLAGTACAQSGPHLPIPSATDVEAAFEAKRDFGVNETVMFQCPLALSGNVYDRANICISLSDPPDDSKAVYAATVNVVANSGSADRVALYGRAISQAGAAAVWGGNTVVDNVARSGNATHAGSATGWEFDFDNNDCDAGVSPGTTNPSCPTWTKELWLTGYSSHPVTDGVLLTAGQFATPQRHFGIRAVGASIQDAFLYDASNATTSFFGAGSHVYGIDFTTATFSLPNQAVGTGAAMRFTNEQYVCFQPDCSYKLGFNGPSAAPAFLSPGGNSVKFPSDGSVRSTGPGVFASLVSNGPVLLANGAYVAFLYGSNNANGPLLATDATGLTLTVGTGVNGGGNLATSGRMHIGACPSSPSGLVSGDLWCNGNVVTRVP